MCPENIKEKREFKKKIINDWKDILFFISMGSTGRSVTLVLSDLKMTRAAFAYKHFTRWFLGGNEKFNEGEG